MAGDESHGILRKKKKKNALNKSEPSLYVGLLLSFTLCCFCVFLLIKKQAFLANTGKQIS